ncbi:MAG: ABC transporter ATP-binding protein [Thermotogae bacterium]|nr:MAG: ABC transporter ATP-binding protein [Thermotogota bacterium]
MLELRNVEVCYGPVRAVKNISFVVKRGSITALLGANGSGKSSTLYAVAGTNTITEGQILYDSKRIDHLPAYERVRNGIVLCPESGQIFAQMTVLENLRAGAYSRRDSYTDELRMVFDLFPRLKERQKQLAGTLSGGERQMLAIARALMARPRFLMLDEPSMGLAPNLVSQIMKTIQRIRSLGVTVLLVEQNAFSALKISDYAYVLQTGKLVMEGKASEMLRDKRIIERYLGG